MRERLVRAACPHDCPDTCAMLVTVDESGRATQVTAASPSSPTATSGRWASSQCDSMSARVMHAIGATELERTICASAGVAGVRATHGASPEVDPEEWPNARYLLVWG